MKKNTIDNVIKDLLLESEICKRRNGKNFFFMYSGKVLGITYLWDGKNYESLFEYEEVNEDDN